MLVCRWYSDYILDYITRPKLSLGRVFCSIKRSDNMTIEEKKEKLRNIIENRKGNPIDIALAILSATSANIDPKALGDILSPEQLASVKKQMEKYLMMI